MNTSFNPWLVVIGIGFFSSWIFVHETIRTLTIPFFLGYFFLLAKNERPFFRLFLLMSIIFLFVFPPIFGNFYFNHDEKVVDVLPAVKAATQYVLQGKNPYAESYYGTVLEKAIPYNIEFWNRQGQGYLPIDHFVYLPAIFLASIPYEWFFPQVSYLGINGIFMVVLAAILLVGIRSIEGKERALTLFFFNPFFYASLLIVHPVDLFILLLVAFLGVLIVNHHIRAAAVTLGVLLATKIYVLALAPFVFWYWWKKKETTPIFISLFVFLGILSPFLLSNATAVVDDTVFFLVGIGENSLTIWGERQGFLPLLVQNGIIPNTLTWVSIPLMIVGYGMVAYRYTRARLEWKNVFLYSAMGVFIALFFSKSMNENYVAFPYFLLLGFFLVWIADMGRMDD